MNTARNRLARYHFLRGCLVSNLSQELGSTDPLLSKKLQAVFRRWESWIDSVLAQAKARNELPPDTDTESLSRIFWIGWQGAILRAKLERSEKPPDDFSNFFIAYATQGGKFYKEKVR
jgi:TetR/AcrR family transcriptional regulator, transcriptional repressor for nem operon